MNEELKKDKEELKDKNKGIKNLKINTRKFMHKIPYVLAVTAPLVINKALYDDIPFIKNNEKKYYESITTIDQDENISSQESYVSRTDITEEKDVITVIDSWKQDESGKYIRSIKEYEIDDTLSNLIKYVKESPETLEEIFTKPDKETIETKLYVSEAELEEAPKVVANIYEHNMKQYINVKESTETNIERTLVYIGGTIVSFILALVYEDKRKKKYQKELKKQSQENNEENQKVLSKNHDN